MIEITEYDTGFFEIKLLNQLHVICTIVPSYDNIPNLIFIRVGSYDSWLKYFINQLRVLCVLCGYTFFSDKFSLLTQCDNIREKI